MTQTICLLDLSTLCGSVVNKQHYQTIISMIESHWVLHSYGLVPHPSKKICTLLPRRPGLNPRSSLTKDSKMVLDAALLNTQHYKVRIRGKVEQSKERSSDLPYTLV